MIRNRVIQSPVPVIWSLGNLGNDAELGRLKVLEFPWQIIGVAARAVAIDAGVGVTIDIRTGGRSLLRHAPRLGQGGVVAGAFAEGEFASEEARIIEVGTELTIDAMDFVGAGFVTAVYLQLVFG